MVCILYPCVAAMRHPAFLAASHACADRCTRAIHREDGESALQWRKRFCGGSHSHTACSLRVAESLSALREGDASRRRLAVPLSPERREPKALLTMLRALTAAQCSSPQRRRAPLVVLILPGCRHCRRLQHSPCNIVDTTARRLGCCKSSEMVMTAQQCHCTRTMTATCTSRCAPTAAVPPGVRTSTSATQDTSTKFAKSGY